MSFDFRRQKFLSFTVVLLTLSIGVLIGTVLNTGVKAARESSAPGATPLQIPPATQLQNSSLPLRRCSNLQSSISRPSICRKPPQRPR